MGKQSAINVQPLNMYARVATARDACAQVGLANTSGGIYRIPSTLHPRPVYVTSRAERRRLFPWPVGIAAWLALPYLHVISRLFAQVGNSSATPSWSHSLVLFFSGHPPHPRFDETRVAPCAFRKFDQIAKNELWGETGASCGSRNQSG